MRKVFSSIKGFAGAALLGITVVAFTACSTSNEVSRKSGSEELQVQSGLPAKNVQRAEAPQTVVTEIPSSTVQAPELVAMEEVPVAIPADPAAVVKTPGVTQNSMPDVVTVPSQNKDEVAPVKTKVQSSIKQVTGKLSPMMGTGLKLLIIGIGMLILAIILGLLAGAGGSVGLALIAGILWLVGGILVLVGLIIWIVELVA
ncbi:MAG: hypothetical protein M3Q97_09395 [Bacteroidota bacterium]|nr:hypothetical protein [Bacteroidota bacterium]